MATMPVNIPRQVGLYVARSRKAQGITRVKLAELAGVSERSLASLEVGEAAGIRLDKLLAIYDALGLSLLTQGESIDENESDAFSETGAADRGSSVPVDDLAFRAAEKFLSQSRQGKRFSHPKSFTKSTRATYPDDYNLALNDFIQSYTNVSSSSPVSFTEKRG